MKYYKKEDVISFLNTHCPKDMWEYQIADLPTIDIVLCKDCIRAKSWKCPFYRAGYTYKADDFCSDGERSEE